MNKKQKAVLQTITTKEWIEWKIKKYIYGNMAFNITEIGDSVMLHAFNNDESIWDKHISLTLFVGVRGGIRNLNVHIF